MSGDCGNLDHMGHKRYTGGGCMDGVVTGLFYADASDFPQSFATVLREGTRSWYEIDADASDGTEVVYRFVGLGTGFPARDRKGGG